VNPEKQRGEVFSKDEDMKEESSVKVVRTLLVSLEHRSGRSGEKDGANSLS